MREFTLPLGMFQVHAATGLLAEAVERLRNTLEAHEQLLRELREDDSQLVTRNAEILDMIQRIGDDADAFNRALTSGVEFPEPLPGVTRELIFASIVAQAFDLKFEVVNFDLNAETDDQASWHVTGQLTEKDGKATTAGGVSFAFPTDDQERAEGALLSACAEAFVHCVHNVVPFFPWDRVNRYDDSVASDEA